MAPTIGIDYAAPGSYRRSRRSYVRLVILGTIAILIAYVSNPLYRIARAQWIWHTQLQIDRSATQASDNYLQASTLFGLGSFARATADGQLRKIGVMVLAPGAIEVGVARPNSYQCDWLQDTPLQIFRDDELAAAWRDALLGQAIPDPRDDARFLIPIRLHDRRGELRCTLLSGGLVDFKFRWIGPATQPVP